MSDLSALSNGAFAVGNISNLILATPEITGIQAEINDTDLGESFIFDYEGENNVTLESDITDHFSEGNFSLNDQIALRPIIITTLGFIGELNNVPPKALKALDEATKKLTAITGFAPELTLAANRAYDLAFQGYQAAEKLLQLSKSKFGDNESQTKQQIAYTKFHEFWEARTLFTVQTPWGKFNNCAIQSLNATQDEDSVSVSTFEVIFKKMRFADTATEADPKVLSGRLANQSQKGFGVDKGLNSPAPTKISIGEFL